MLEVSNVKVYDLEESVISCRNAMRLTPPEYTDDEFEKSLPRAIQLANTPNGSGHQTWLSGIRVSFDLKYPNYISPELQRYHWVDIVTSSSKMHRLMEMDLDMACNKFVPRVFIDEMRKLVDRYKGIKDSPESHEHLFVLRDGTYIWAESKQRALYFAFMQCISACPQGIELFMRVSTNYLQLRTIYHQRKHHKLVDDWQVGFCEDFVSKLPYANEFIIGTKDDSERKED